MSWISCYKYTSSSLTVLVIETKYASWLQLISCTVAYVRVYEYIIIIILYHDIFSDVRKPGISLYLAATDLEVAEQSRALWHPKI